MLSMLRGATEGFWASFMFFVGFCPLFEVATCHLRLSETIRTRTEFPSGSTCLGSFLHLLLTSCPQASVAQPEVSFCEAVNANVGHRVFDPAERLSLNSYANQRATDTLCQIRRPFFHDHHVEQNFGCIAQHCDDQIVNIDSAAGRWAAQKLTRQISHQALIAQNTPCINKKEYKKLGVLQEVQIQI